jgi:hypothetical protein
MSNEEKSPRVIELDEDGIDKVKKAREGRRAERKARDAKRKHDEQNNGGDEWPTAHKQSRTNRS